MSLLAFALLGLSRGLTAETKPGATFFENRIRPLLVEHCFSCHGADKQKSGLRVDSREALLLGGERGPALVPGQPGQSRLLEAVAYTNADLQMPPKKKLGQRQVAELAQWILSGAPWPEAMPAAKVVKPGKESIGTNVQDHAWWAFQPIQRPALPKTQAKTENPIDSFVFAQLEARGLVPNPRATPRELIRRIYFDLLGLPPSPEAVAAFVAAPSPKAWEQLIDDLLAQPQYGERWGRHWLDVVRYAQSNGYERDGEKPYAWRFRDYVVKAFNEDKPYDQFVREQVAGDELEPLTLDGLIATGFQRLGVWDDEPDDKRMADFDELDDILSTTGTTFLGLTLGCARCHDHKFDPIPQTDYYKLLTFFRNVSPYENARYALDSPNYVPLASRGEVDGWKTEHEDKLKRLQAQVQATTNAESKKKLNGELEQTKGTKLPFEWALAVRERGAKPPATHVLIRGNAGNPGAEVQPAFPTALGGLVPVVNAPPGGRSSGRRRALAEWLTSAEHPLTARVMVNRVWQHHFGRGIVRTTSDFGRAGVAPTHPQLLDWLASEFMAQGWSLKRLHKLILQSATYQMSSRTDYEPARSSAPRSVVDPGNELFWRQNLRRLEAESLRDTILAISGQLNLRMAGRGFFPRVSGEALAGQSRPGLDWERSPAAESSRRSLYAYVRRTMLVPVFEAFDYNNTATPLSERPVTTVAPQALLLLNDEFMRAQAKAFANRLQLEDRSKGTAPVEQQIERGFQLAVGRSPSRAERRVAREFLAEQERAFLPIMQRRTFNVEVPASLSVDYMGKLRSDDFLTGPGEGWSYYRGTWSGPYEGIRTVDRTKGPFALARQEPFVNGAIDAQLLLHNTSESAGLLVRAQVEGEELRGYELHLDPRRQMLSLRRHEKQSTNLAEVSCPIAMAQPVGLRVEAHGGKFRVWKDGTTAPLLDFTDPTPRLAPGGVGVKTWGAPLSVDKLTVQSENGPAYSLERNATAAAESPSTASGESPSQRALEAFCLLLLNLNEVVYVD